MLETELQKYGGNLKKLVKAGDIKRRRKRTAPTRGRTLPGHRSGTVTRPPPGSSCCWRRPTKATEDAGAITQLFQKIRRKTESPVLINGVEDVMVTYAVLSAGTGRERDGICYSRTRHHRPSLDLPTPRPRAGASRPRPMARPGKGRHTGEVRIVCTDTMGMLAEIGAVQDDRHQSHGWRPVAGGQQGRDHPRGLHHGRR